MIIHINGWPGVGKYTIGKELAKRIEARFIHNHLLHDVAFACTGRTDADRWPLYEQIRSAAYEALSRRPSSEVFVMTNALCNGVTREVDAWGKVVDLAMSRSARLIPVILRADTESIARRSLSDNRSSMKLKDPIALRDMISKYTLQVPDVLETLEVDVSDYSVGDATNEILAHVIENEKIAKPTTLQHNLLK